MKNICFLIIFVISFFLINCEEKKNEKPFITIQPEDLYISAFNSEKLIFTINVISDYPLTQFLITKKYEGGNETTILDSSVNLKNLDFQWPFITPSENTEDLILYFKASNTNGFQSAVGRRLVFSGIKFEETTGLRIYSSNSNLPTALNLIALETVTLSSDSTYRDIQELQNDTASTTLARKWFSPSGCKFVRFNDYDYANANSSTAKSAFEAGIDLTEISNLAVGDIIIVKITRQLPDAGYVIVKITDIIDNPGNENDFYEVSVKQ